MTINKVIIKNIGYNFNKENFKYFESLSGFDRINTLYVLPNYLQLENNRKKLTEKLGAIRSENIMTFDDLASRFFPDDKNIINKEKASWIIKKIIEKNNLEKLSTSLGTAKDILNYIYLMKSHKINAEIYLDAIEKIEDLKDIGFIFKEYEDFLMRNKLYDEIDVYVKSSENIGKNKINIGTIIINGFLEFRPQELFLLKSLCNENNSIIIEYPYSTKKNNIKFVKTIKKLKELGFLIEKDYEEIKNEPEKLGYNLLSYDESRFDIDTTIIKASSKYYEVVEVFRNIKEKLEYMDIKDISIIGSSDYEIIIKNVGKDFGIPISVMNEESGRDLPFIRSILNFLEFILKDEKTNFISLINDENINYEFRELKDYLTKSLNELEYKGLGYDYLDLEDDFSEFLSYMDNVAKEYKKDPLDKLENFLDNKNISQNIMKSYKVHNDLEVLKTSLRGLELVKDSIEEIKTFSNLVKLDGEEIIEILIYYLDNVKFYSNSDTEGILFMDYINSLGSKSKVRYFLGLNIDFPTIKGKGFLYSKRFNKLFEKLNIDIESNLENLDNKTLQFSQSISNSDINVLSYVYPDEDLENEFSIYLKDYLRRIKNNITEIKTASITKEIITDKDNIRDRILSDSYKFHRDEKIIELNYLCEKDLNYLNKKINNIYLKDNFEEKYWGSIESFPHKDFLSLSQGMIDTFNSCPFKYFMKYILGIEKLLLDYKDEFFLDLGINYHDILSLLYKNDDVLNLSEIEIKEKINIRVEDKLKYNGMNDEEIDIQRKMIKDYIYDFILIDKKLRDNFKVEFKPSLFEKEFSKKIENIEIYGRVDRIDIDEEERGLVIDYKTKYAPSQSEVRKFENLQLPIYALLYGEEKAIGGFYGIIEKPEIQQTFYLKNILKNSRKGTKLSQEELNNFYSLLKDRIIEIGDSIRKGDFFVKPINDKICNYCDYKDICRKEELEDEIQ